MKKWMRYLFLFLFIFCIYEFFGFSNTYGDPLNFLDFLIRMEIHLIIMSLVMLLFRERFHI